MSNIMSHTEWEEAADHGTSGDMVHDILASWKADNARLRELLGEVITDHADFGQLFNAAFNDWKAENCWSEWDEQTYQKHIALIAKIAKLTAALEKP